MPIVEQLIYGTDGQNSRRCTVLAQSPGLGQGVASEIRQLCEGWGEVPVGGLAHPALLSIPLKNPMASLRGRLYAIVQLGPGHTPLHHALVMNEADYAAFGHNPFAVQRAFAFLESWRDGIIVDQETIDPGADARLVDPPPARSDMALVGESLRQLFLQSNLLLPLAQPSAESDRTLALVVASLPNPLRRELRFASFAAAERSGFQIAALSTPNCAFSGWQRLLLTQVAAIVPDDVEQYVGAVGSYLSAGDLPGLCRLGREQMAVPGAALSAPEPVADRPLATRAGPSTRAAAPPQRQAAVPLVRREQSPFGPVAPPRPPRRRPRSRTSRLVSSRRVDKRPGPPSARGYRVMPLVVLGIVLTALVWWRMDDVERFVGQRFGWTRAAHNEESDHPTTLLSVVDVGEVYDRLIRRVSRAGLIGDQDDGRNRREALLALQSEAAGPLLEQLDLFVTLAADGIQQAGRPDRERERLRALSLQGERLQQQMGRLELAWHSLQTETDWRDLNRLDDRAVAARRDSLNRAATSALIAAGRELGTTPARRTLAAACRRVVGMSDLITLLHTETWSPNWEDRVEAAAELVSPRASAATRAYRNSAFAFVRLKRAERSAAARNLPYTNDFRDGVWPCREVRDVLPELRNELSRFGRAYAPQVLKATLELYAKLENCAGLARDAAAGDVLDGLAGNAAVRFDQGSYREYLERIRFEAARGLFEAQRDSSAVPEHLYGGAEVPAAYRFFTALVDSSGPEIWRREQARQELPFLARWARHREKSALANEAGRRADFDAAWGTCVSLLTETRERVERGADWTSAWLDLREKAAALRITYGLALAGDPERAARLGRITTLLTALDRPRELALTSVTVRLPAAALPVASSVFVELVGPDGTALISGPVAMGPASPADSGWVGTLQLDWRLSLEAGDGLAVRVLGSDAVGEHFAVTYPALRERVGPGALVRPRGDESGSVAFQFDPGWWRSLTLPELE